MLKIYQKTIKEMRIRSIKRIRVGSWVDAIAPTDEEITQLVTELHLEEGLIRDSLDPYEVPRLEVKNGIVYFFVRFPRVNEKSVETIPALIAVGEDFVVTVSSIELPFTDKFTKRPKGETLPIDISTTQKTRLVSLFLYEINNEYNNFLIRIRRQVQSSQVSLENIGNDNIMHLVLLESTLNDFLSALQPMNNALQTLQSGKILPLFARDKDFIEDLFLSNGQIIESCKANLKNIINIREAYTTIMTNNLNRILRFFAALTIILTIPTIVGSLYGMNVPLPFMDSRFTFFGILGLACLFSFIFYRYFKKRNWV